MSLFEAMYFSTRSLYLAIGVDGERRPRSSPNEVLPSQKPYDILEYTFLSGGVFYVNSQKKFNPRGRKTITLLAFVTKLTRNQNFAPFFFSRFFPVFFHPMFLLHVCVCVCVQCYVRGSEKTVMAPPRARQSLPLPRTRRPSRRALSRSRTTTVLWLRSTA